MAHPSARSSKNSPRKIAVPEHRFQHVHLDLIGPLPPCKSFRYCLTMIDRFSRWPEAIPLTEISAETVSTAFFSHWVARYGAPHTITTDQGSQFEAALFRALTNLLGCERVRTSAYHPASNGIRFTWPSHLLQGRFGRFTSRDALWFHTSNSWRIFF